MKPYVKIFLSVIILVALGNHVQAGSWETDRTEEGIQHMSLTGHDNAGFIVHEVGDDDDLLIYSFYLIADPHIGGVTDYPDYNEYGCTLSLNLERDPLRMGNPNGSWPGVRLNWAVNLINDHYDYGQGEGRFCVVLGDLSNTGEVAELQHASVKLDSLDCPWVPVIGNHDTYPYAGDFWSGFGTDTDQFFGEIYESRFHKAKMAFPNWTKSSVPNSVPRWHNFSFRWGPNHHQGLDWVKRSLGGFQWEAELYDNDVYWPLGTYHWFEDDLDYHSPSAQNLLIFAHHPLTSSQWLYFFDQFQLTERTKVVEAIDNEFDPVITQWFSGHVHPQGFWFLIDPRPSERWYVGMGSGQNKDTVVEVRLFPGVQGKEGLDGNDGNGDPEKQYYVGLVRVYGKYKCDFSYYHPSSHTDFPNVGDPVNFTDESECSYGWSATNHFWQFGDNYGSHSSDPSHTYKSVAKYYTRLAVTFGNQITHSSKTILVGFHYPHWGHVEVYL